MSARLLLDYMRDDVGVPCNALTRTTHVGWTMDADKAQLAREAGARVQVVPQGDSVGFDISFPIGTAAP